MTHSLLPLLRQAAAFAQRAFCTLPVRFAVVVAIFVAVVMPAHAATPFEVRVTGTGPPSIFTTLGQHPRLFRAWLRYSAQLMPFGHLPRRDTELVILRVAWECRSAYEWHQHVPIALRVGLTPDEVAGVADRSAEDVFTGRQQALLAVSDELLARRELSDTTWSAVQATLGNREAIELCLLVGNYQGLASTIGGLGIQIEQDPGRQG